MLLGICLGWEDVLDSLHPSECCEQEWVEGESPDQRWRDVW